LTTEWIGSRTGADAPGFPAEYSDSLTLSTRLLPRTADDAEQKLRL